ncbi:MAG: SusC/RagA family TonB-linked outer membrane protein [Longimicrobiales bacterium]
MGLRLILTALTLTAVTQLMDTADLKAQATGSVTGTVTNRQSGQPLVGAQINLTNTRHGGLTDQAGRFNILNVPAGTYTVVVTFLGFTEGRHANIAVRAGQPSSLTFQLQETVLSLQQLVVTGVTDPTSGLKLPFTVAKVNAEQLQVAPSGSALEMIAGKVAGAYVVRNSGKPGSDAEIQLRSATAFETSSRPLFVIDGVVVATDNMGRENQTGSLGMFTASPLADIDPSEIESIEIIKGAAAASLYGSRAAGGVISITTNRGKNLARGTTRITSRVEFGQNFLLGSLPVTTSHHYLVNAAGTSLMNTAGRDTSWSGRTVDPTHRRIADISYPGRIFDNFDAVYNPGNYLSNTLSFSQAGENTTVLVSAARRDDAGALNGNDGRQQYSGRISIDHRMGDKLSLSFVGSHARTRDDGESGNPFTSILTYPAFVDLTQKDAQGRYLMLPDPSVEIENPIWRQTSRDNFTTRASTLASLNTRYSLNRSVTLDAQLSYDRADNWAQVYIPKGTPTSVTSDLPSNGELEYEQQQNDAINGSLGGTLARQFGLLNARLTTRGTFEKELRETFSVRGRDFLVKDTRDLSATRETSSWASSTTDIRANGVLADIGLDYNDRYITSFLVRRDGSSLFGADQKWHTYKRASAKYRLSEEEWFNVPFVDELGIRYAMGEAGGRPCYTCQYEQWNPDRDAGLTRETAGNPQLRPSFTREQEVGIDLIAFNNKLQLELVYAHQVSRDQIIIVPATVATGFSSLRANAGELKGRTLEATVTFNAIRTNNFSWSINAFGDNTNTTLTKWGRSCFFGSNTNREHEYTCAGQRMGDFWIFDFLRSKSDLPWWLQSRADEFDINDDGYVVWVGKDPATGQSNTWRQGLSLQNGQCANAQTGTNTCGWGSTTAANSFTYRWGEPFLARDSAGILERHNLGSSLPDLNFGLGTNMTYKQFSAYAQFRGRLGGKIYNRARNWTYNNLRHGDLDQRGKPDELKKTIDYYQRALAQNDNCNSSTQCTSFYSEFLEDATHLKLSELRVGYRFDRAQLRRIMGSVAPAALTLGIAGTELFTLTGYSGFDPEAGSPLSAQEAITYPHLRSLRMTVDITF